MNGTFFKKVSMAISAAALVSSLVACAPAQHPLRFAPSGITRVQYEPKKCSQLPDGAYRCKDVVFTVATVQAPAKTK